MAFNEDTRVKIPTIMHLVRLGYHYLSLKTQQWDINTNIFPELFHQAVTKINPHLEQDDVGRLLEEVKLSLDNEDLGKAFYDKLTARSGTKLIDFEHFNNNSFHVVTELTYKNGDEEFRPDITLLINGMPLVFIEVKKPNNPEGILAERDRINKRFQNKKFKRFVNITQFMIFSNNMEYEDGAVQPLQGAFYASASYGEPIFNYFREEQTLILPELSKPLDEQKVLEILKDNNKETLQSSEEFKLNKNELRPTNRICTSLLSKDRLAFILRYALTYVAETQVLEKHIMRYPQIFATKAIEHKLNEGIKKGIIWHTQGSGKTALAYYNVRFLTDYFQQKQIIPKFYFIVDRIDLLTQAQREFTCRGLTVYTIDSREAFSQDIKATKAIHNNTGKPEITVVNIQKFKDDPDVVSTSDYDVSIQRVYFLDEVHRSYNPKGSFLANLEQSDRNAIKIGLTGTPLLGTDYNSRQLFGDYIHKYYYNASIADGYTLRLIREEIATHYKMALQKALEEAEIQQGDVDKKFIYAHPSFVDPMLDYIIADFQKSRGALAESTIGAMVICDSAEQAKQLFKLFNDRYPQNNQQINQVAANDNELTQLKVAEPITNYAVKRKQDNEVKTAALILHDVGTKQQRKDWVEDFKAGKIDLLFVFNMLLTGFDARRLKKLYLGRVIRSHNLLQALTRVNRPYKDFRYGYVVDFADIRKEFDDTNKAYFKELQDELGDEIESYSQLFKSQEEIQQEIEQIKDMLFKYDITNAEIFSQQINEIDDRETILALKKALANAKSLYNLIRLQGESSFLDQLDFNKLNLLYREATNRLNLLNLKENLEKGTETTNLLNIALENILFEFIKVGEDELQLADDYQQTLRRTREALNNNFDQDDPKFITLKEELERLFKKKNLSATTQEEMKTNTEILNKIYERVKVLNRENNLLRQKYSGDVKYARIHKRITEKNEISANERKIFEALNGVKHDTDEQILQNLQLLNNEGYFKQITMPTVIKQFMTQQQIKLNPATSCYINELVVKEYLKEFTNGAPQW
ncbi:restriction endonuclease subunit R [Snodgrassella alvi]|uniref:type I site-specific deoxyribonuclease n=1 Tax=Snodgrassella alvi TaxID=1196083 RepID=A0A2N9WQZ6_9NEIS|nr:type I restriction endonuclease [Snodgrassella alvi]PIT12285.1 restriction endonuclease subunit R [Snodgrassella alvi]